MHNSAVGYLSLQMRRYSGKTPTTIRGNSSHSAVVHRWSRLNPIWPSMVPALPPMVPSRRSSNQSNRCLGVTTTLMRNGLGDSVIRIQSGTGGTSILTLASGEVIGHPSSSWERELHLRSYPHDFRWVGPLKIVVLE
jgi:hypothetical protein